MEQGGEEDNAQKSDNPRKNNKHDGKLCSEMNNTNPKRGKVYKAFIHNNTKNCVDGTITLHEIADPDTLDTRREAIGLGALDREAAEGAECEAEGE